MDRDPREEVGAPSTSRCVTRPRRPPDGVPAARSLVLEAEAGAKVADPVVGEAEVVRDQSLLGSMWGTRIVSIVRITTVSCSVWLCSTLARIASGVVLSSVEEDGRPRHPLDGRVEGPDRLDELQQRPLLLDPVAGDDAASLLQVIRTMKIAPATTSAPNPMNDLREVGEEEGRSTTRNPTTR